MQSKDGKIKLTSKYDEMLKQYNLDITDEGIKEAVKKIIEDKVPENDTLDVKKFLLGSVELTTLQTDDTEERVLAMVEKVNKICSRIPYPSTRWSCLCVSMLHKTHCRQLGSRWCRYNKRNRKLPFFANIP